MDTSGSEFMLREYQHIANAFFNLQDKANDWFRTYVTLYGLPLTVLVAIIGVSSDGIDISLLMLPDVVSGLLLIVSMLGFFIAMMIVSMRMEMILYARTINAVRRYFAEVDSSTLRKGQHQVVDFLILPTSDTVPPFYEPWRATFWQVLFIGFLNSLTAFLALANLFAVGWFCALWPSLMYFFTHWLLYWAIARRREDSWRPRYGSSLGVENY